MDEDGKSVVRPRRKWLRITGETLAVLVVLLLIFHRPILLGVGRAAANHFARQANLKLDCRLEGTVFTGLVIRNLHVVPTGPTIVESIDVDYLRADYNLIDLARGGVSELVKTVEVRNAKVILDPAKASVKANVPPDQPLSLPKVFPDRLKLTDINVIMRGPPQDFVLQGLDLDLDPKNPGELRIAKLQLPTVPAWAKISGRTSYENKNLVLQDLVLDEGNRFRLIAIDASHIRSNALEIKLDGTLAAGTVVGSVLLTEKAKSLDTRAHVVVENVSLDTVRGYIGRREGELTGTVERMALDFSGLLASPRTWDATVAASVKELTQGGLSLDRCTIGLTARDGTARIDLAELTKGLNKVRLKGNAALPDDIREFGRSPATFEVNALLPDLHGATASMAQPLTGSATVTGTAEISNATLRADLNFGGGPIGYSDGTIGQVGGTIHATKQMPPPNTTKPYYADLVSEIHLNVSDVHSRQYLIDTVHLDLKTVGDLVTLSGAETVRKGNKVVVSGDYRLPEDFSKVRLQPANLEFNFGAIELADFFPPDSPNKLTGPLELNGQVKVRDGVANGQLQIYGSNIHARNLTIQQVSGQASIANNVVYLNDFTANLNAKDYIGGSGVFALDEPHQYRGKVYANVADLSTLKPLLAAAGNQSELAGALMVNWQGSGTISDFKHTGELKVTLEKGRYANLQALQANIDARYTPDELDVPIIFLGSDKMDFQAIMQAKGETLEVTKIQVDQGKAKYASGYVSLPFVWKNLGSDRAIVPENGKVLVTFQSENLDIKKLFDDLGQKAPASGTVNVKLDAKGTLTDLTAKLELQMRDLRSEAAKLEPASFDLSAQLANNQLNFVGKLQQAKIQPVAITASLPLNVSQIVREKKFNEATPVTAKVQLPRSSVNFLRQFVPAISQLDGDMALDVNVNGTVAKPVLSGAGDISVNVARFTNPTLPALSGFKSRLTFAGNTLSFERFDGQLAGGPFRLSGRVTFPKLTEPTLDFQLKADSVLVARNDSLTARADADVRVTGPLKAANVTGNVALTNSQFLKNIDLIPIGLPGRPAPQPPSDREELSFPNPPIRDWKFDVAIKTKDPFLVRGNLANGGAIVDLHLTGTGLHPGLEGQVRLENVEATLPFSRLQITQGFLYFDPSDSLNPKVDLQGTSLIRDYTIHVYVYGTTTAPEVVFTSEPPLPQEEIISLLATGTTREELTGSNNVLAGRAAMLLVQQVYRKVFKKGEATKSNSVFDKLQVDVGNVDPRTGQQTASARFKLNDQFVLIGDIGVGGGFRGIVKYLIRFK